MICYLEQTELDQLLADFQKRQPADGVELEGRYAAWFCEVTMSSRVKRWSIVVFGLLSLGYGYWRYEFPYGYSHCCDLILHQALEEYAAEHDGFFPAGQPTPEASLSLLYPNYAGAYLLGGKAVPESAAQAILDGPSPLGPETCSWHYVEGLTIYDDPRLALFWDKTGLGHIALAVVEALPDARTAETTECET